jgi:hypothetical protein
MKKTEKVKKSSYNLYTDILNPLHWIIGEAHIGDTLNNVDDLVEFLIKKNPSIKNDLVEYVKSKNIPSIYPPYEGIVSTN